MELFVGIDCSSEVKDELERIQAVLGAVDHSGKYEPKENFHLTLRYIGEVEHMDMIVSCLEPIRYNRFTLQLNGLGIFENPDGNVLWADVRQEYENLQSLHRMINQALSQAEISQQSYTFNPHITLAYGCSPTITSFFPFCEVNPLVFDISSFYLFSVHPSAEGPYFHKVKTFQLSR